MGWETWVQSQVASYQRLFKWYLIPPCLTLSIMRYVSRVKWSNPGKGLAPSPTLRCSSYGKESLRVTFDCGRQLYFYLKPYNGVRTTNYYQIETNFWNSSSSSCRTISTDIPDPLSPLLLIVHHLWQVLRATSRILTEQVYVGSSGSPYFCSAMWGGP